MSDPLVIFTPSGQRGRFPVGTPILTAARQLGLHLFDLLQQDRNVYLHAMQNWNIERIERLKSAGWRKVQQA